VVVAVVVHRTMGGVPSVEDCRLRVARHSEDGQVGPRHLILVDVE
jgi:hypothetical protein